MKQKGAIHVLMQRSFASVDAGRDADSKNAMAKRLSKTIFENFSFDLSTKSLTRYYDQYILEQVEKSIPKPDILDILSKNLGYLDFVEFSRSLNRDRPKKQTLNRYWKLVFGFLGIILVSAFLYYYVESKAQNCMTWNGKAYIECSCERNVHAEFGNPVIRLTEATYFLKDFKKIKISKSTTFFKNNRPVVWYGKSPDGKVEFFNKLSKHPETGKALKAVTQYIVEKYASNKQGN